ncbi:MAG TPA: transglutaminase domain-containing protein [Bacteroidales bacterium]|nr:transglutaminase domain-containing protein [Bacteroidales bacterium]
MERGHKVKISCHNINLKKILTVFVLFVSVTFINAQKESGYNYVSRMMYRIPDSLTQTTDGIASYVNASFSNNKDKSRAIFVWISKNIKYNFDSIITNSIYETPSEVSERILRTRTGVCLNFAHLFNELSNKAGIKSYIIQGYTKQNGKVDYLPHIWCASYIDTAWFLFDPTWGSGYVSRGRYISQVNGYYFMARPEKLIRSHMPFDPMWQFLNYPKTHHEFKNSGYKPDSTKSYFNFLDTLKTWENSTDLQRAVSTARRIEQSGVTNNFVAAKLRVVKGDVEYLSNKNAAQKYDTAVSRYNEGIQVFNRFIGYRNEQVNDSVLLIQILDTSEACLNSALSILSEARGVDEHIISSINMLRNEINNTRMMLNLQRAIFISQLRTRN